MIRKGKLRRKDGETREETTKVKQEEFRKYVNEYKKNSITYGKGEKARLENRYV